MTAKPTHTPKRLRFLPDLLICLLIFAVTLPLVYHFARNGFDPHHSGLMYKSALDVVNGKVLFLETFTQYGALTTWLQALSLLVLGERVNSILFVTALFYAIDFALLYHLARRLLSRGFSLLAVGLTLSLAPFYFWIFHPWSSVFALTFLLLSLEFTLLSLERQGVCGLVFSALSGFNTALCFWCRQPVGIVTALAALLVPVFLIIVRRAPCERRRYVHMLILCAIGIVLGVVALLVPIILPGAARDFVHQSLVGMLRFASDRSSADRFGIFGFLGLLLYDLLLSPFEGFELPGLDILWSVLPLTALVFALVRILAVLKQRKQDPQDPLAHQDLIHLAFGIFAVSAWHQYYPVFCYRHWFWGSFLCVPIVIFYLIHGVQKLLELPRFAKYRTSRHRSLALILAVLILFGPNSGYRIFSAVRTSMEMQQNGVFDSAYCDHLDGLYLDAEQREHFELFFKCVDDLKKQFPDVNVINGTENGVYALFGENFCPMFNNSGDFFYDDYPKWLAEYIATERPIYVGPHAPSETYVLYISLPGDGGDNYALWHGVPAAIYLPIELYVQLNIS